MAALLPAERIGGLASLQPGLRPMSATGVNLDALDGQHGLAECPRRIQWRRISASQRTEAMCHVWTAPSWQGLSSRLQHWSVQPCVRPLDAVHMTAGHNALRGSGPGQKPAFDNNAMARVGCPDRRIDRLCITCCSSSQPSHHAQAIRAILLRERDGSDLGRASDGAQASMPIRHGGNF